MKYTETGYYPVFFPVLNQKGGAYSSLSLTIACL